MIYPFLGLAFFPSTDAGQFTINMKVPTGTRLEVTEQYVAKVEDLIRNVVGSKDLKMVVSNIGVVPDFSSLYTTNAGPYTATIQVALQDDHQLEQLRVYGAGAERNGEPIPGYPHILFERFHGGCHSELRNAGAD